MRVYSLFSLRGRMARLTARALFAIAALPLAACSGGGDAPRDGGSGGARPVFFISALDIGGGPLDRPAPRDRYASFLL